MSKEYYKAHPDKWEEKKQKENAKQRWTRPEEKAKKKIYNSSTEARAARAAHKYVYLYGITLEDKNALLEKQNYRCKSCGSGDPGNKTGRWHVDHIKGTKIIRGILCQRCNQAIGLARENPDALRAMARYLETWNG